MTNNEHKPECPRKLKCFPLGKGCFFTDFNGNRCDCTCHSQPSVAEWEKGFRQIISDNDDSMNEHDFSKPIKGDIYFDGIEVEQFVRNQISLAYAQGKQDERKRMVGIIKKDGKEAFTKMGWGTSFIDALLAAIDNMKR